MQEAENFLVMSSALRLSIYFQSASITLNLANWNIQSGDGKKSSTLQSMHCRSYNLLILLKAVHKKHRLNIRSAYSFLWRLGLNKYLLQRKDHLPQDTLCHKVTYATNYTARLTQTIFIHATSIAKLLNSMGYQCNSTFDNLAMLQSQIRICVS